MDRLIKLTRNKSTIVDEEDYNYLCKFSWFAQKTSNKHKSIFYAVRTDNKKKKSFKMQRVILKIKNSSIFVDHINGNTLDNRKCNLRICTRNENARNRRKSKINKSGYKGVSICKNKWIAMIRVNGKQIYLGVFKYKIDAAKAYNKAAIKFHGKFANLNKK